MDSAACGGGGNLIVPGMYVTLLICQEKLFFIVLFLATSEWERTKFFWILGLRRTNHDQDPLENKIKSCTFQEVFDEIQEVRFKRESHNRAKRFLSKIIKNELL